MRGSRESALKMRVIAPGRGRQILPLFRFVSDCIGALDARASAAHAAGYCPRRFRELPSCSHDQGSRCGAETPAETGATQASRRRRVRCVPETGATQASSCRRPNAPVNGRPRTIRELEVTSVGRAFAEPNTTFVRRVGGTRSSSAPVLHLLARIIHEAASHARIPLFKSDFS